MSLTDEQLSRLVHYMWHHRIVPSDRVILRELLKEHRRRRPNACRGWGCLWDYHRSKLYHHATCSMKDRSA